MNEPRVRALVSEGKAASMGELVRVSGQGGGCGSRGTNGPQAAAIRATGRPCPQVVRAGGRPRQCGSIAQRLAADALQGFKRHKCPRTKKPVKTTGKTGQFIVQHSTRGSGFNLQRNFHRRGLGGFAAFYFLEVFKKTARAHHIKRRHQK